jgi:hypothetical protein
VLRSLPAARQPMEMVQEEGQVIYIPEGWYQASLPLPHPQGGSAFLSPLLSSIRHSTHHPSSCSSDPSLGEGPPQDSASATEIILTLSLRQTAAAPEVEGSLYFQLHRAAEALAAKEHLAAVEILRDLSVSFTEFSSSYLLGKALAELIQEKVSSSHSPRREELSQDLVEEAQTALRRAIALNR